MITPPESSTRLEVSSTRLEIVNRLGRAMADPSRSRILLLLIDGPAYPAGIASSLSLTRQNVSNHLTCLRDCGIVVSKAEGRQHRYEIADAHLTQALTELVSVVLAVDQDAPCLNSTCTVTGCCGTAP